MSETDLFKSIISRDPTPGKQNRLKIISHNVIEVPGWFLGNSINSILITFGELKRKYNITTQILYDILELGLTDISQRPKCPICEKTCKFSGISVGGYYKTCGNSDCYYKSIGNTNSTNKNKIKKLREDNIKKFIKDISNPNVENLTKHDISFIRNLIKNTDEKSLFDRLHSIDPNPGKQNRIVSDGDYFVIPGWISIDNSIIDNDGFIRIKKSSMKSVYKRSLSTTQILHDILVKGLISINDRPLCPICGKPAKFKPGEGYYSTCGDRQCKNKLMSIRETENNPFNGEFTPEHRKKISEGVRLAIKEGKLFNENTNKRNNTKYISGKISISKSEKDLYYDSSWELDFIKFCNYSNNVVSIERSSLRLSYEFEGKKHYYLPDFEIKTINNLKILIEIKPYILSKTDNKTMEKIKTGENYILSDSNDFSKFIVLTEKELFIKGKQRKGINKDLLTLLLAN